MSTFTSQRERRLWGWTLAVVVAIYSSLGLARTLSDELRRRDLMDGLFFLGFLAIVAAVVLLALTRRRTVMEIGVGLGISAVYLMVFLRMAVPEERTHLVEYGVVALFIYHALTERALQEGRVARPALKAILAASVIGVIDETIQLFIPSRVFDPIDMVFNSLAAVMAVSATVVLVRVRNRRDP